ncbi:hypothetical protein GH146_00275 [archaeon]|nr:hypothetical protein [archaeon]
MKDNQGSYLSTKTHDKMIKEAVRWAKSLGYGVVEQHPGTETGADAIFQNQYDEQVILEVVTGASFKKLFQKPRIREIFIRLGKYHVKSDILGLIVVGDRIKNVKDHGIKSGLPNEIFEPPKQRVFPVLVLDFERVIPVLLVSLLGARASAYPRWSP